ncbi:hypothetical protein FKW77_000825 [Venturia effusa]|uniref:Activator of Hsp90 ATPase AHSA1-like N-terminal domain-containing protein n=1 Tax=Venturia effusa TaxID=50376 RepID=A0A517LGF5_9PEZI|nr:hypothetical protein FKW77_000825 [Venturia effusa]
MVLHNPNNWHWVSKDVSGSAKAFLENNLVGISAEDGDVSAKIDNVLSMDGDCDVSQRKGKVITIFDVVVKLEWSGTTKDVSASGTITIPEVAHDTDEDEYVFEVSLYSEETEKTPIKELVRSKIVPQLRPLLQKLAPALIAEHGKDIQHAPGSNPSSGFSTPKHVPISASNQASKLSSTVHASTEGTVNVTTVTDSTEFRTSAAELYQTFTDPQRIAAFTRSAPLKFDGAQIGGKFELFGGNVTGEYIELEEPTKIVQRWRLAQWPPSHFSTLNIRFEQNNVDSVTVMRVDWQGVPIGQEDVTKRNWGEYYVRSIKQTFGFGTIL